MSSDTLLRVGEAIFAAAVFLAVACTIISIRAHPPDNADRPFDQEID